VSSLSLGHEYYIATGKFWLCCPIRNYIVTHANESRSMLHIICGCKLGTEVSTECHETNVHDRQAKYSSSIASTSSYVS
jgi:hypothetical protein